MERKLSFLFVVQGEGRGHMTQAIAMHDMLVKNNYEVCCVLVGKSKQREIPEFVTRNLKCEVLAFESPNFVTDSKMKSVKMFRSVSRSLMRINIFKASINFIHSKVKKYKPDVIINFYDPLVSLYNLMYSPKCTFISIAHQNIFLHKEYVFPKGQLFNKMGLINYTQLNSLKADLRLALSFYPLKDVERKKLIVVPPLLRKEVFQQNVEKKGYLLVYLVNRGYIEDVVNWHERNANIILHCFTDRKTELEEEEINKNLFFHKLNDKKFLEMMAGADALVSTAGFESVGECMYLGKPALLVPIQGHFEQYCNARDAHRSGGAIFSDEFKLDNVLDYASKYQRQDNKYRKWVESSEKIIIEAIEDAHDFKTGYQNSFVGNNI